MNEERYCVTLSKAEFMLLLGARGVDALFGFETDEDSLDEHKVAEALLRLVERGLAKPEENEVLLTPQLRRVIGHIAGAEYMLAVENTVSFEKSCCVYCAHDGCTVVSERPNGMLLFMEMSFDEWLNMCCNECVPQRVLAAREEFSDPEDDDSYVGLLMCISIHKAKSGRLIEGMRINDHVAFATIACDEKRPRLYSAERLREVIIRIIGEEHGIS